MVDVNKTVGTVIAVIFVLAVLPLAFDEVAAFAIAYPEWATIIGLVSLALIFGLVRSVLKSSGATN